MRIFIFEHICGGGMAGVDLTSKLVWEGGAMLRAAVEDFVKLGVDVVTTLDERVPLPLPGARVTPVRPGSDFGPVFDRLAAEADAALLIAPEFDGLLERWSGRVRAMGVRLLGCGPRGVASVADKFALAAQLLGAGVPTPVTTLGIEPPPPPGSWPVVVKPRCGAGCERTYLCRGQLDLNELPPHNDWIVQPLVEGIAASAAFLVNDSQVRPLQAGRQFIGGKHQFFYHGGEMPLPPEMWRRAMALGERAVSAVVSEGNAKRQTAGEGLHGYVGVDLVLGETAAADRVIEINPRLTVAYVGMRALCKNNLAAAILDHVAPLEWRSGRVSYDASGHTGLEAEA